MLRVTKLINQSNIIQSISQRVQSKYGLMILICLTLATAVSCAATPTPDASAPPAAQSTSSGPAEYEGFLDVVNCQNIGGWAWNQVAPDTPVSVDIFFDNALATTMVANQPRLDLKQAGKGNGVHGFTLAIPSNLKDGKPHAVQAKVARTSTALPSIPSVASPGQTPSITCS